MYLIVVESRSGGKTESVIYQPYRLAVSQSEAMELMADYMKHGADDGALCPEFFALYKERDGELGSPDYYDPATCQIADDKAVQEWLAETGRC